MIKGFATVPSCYAKVGWTWTKKEKRITSVYKKNINSSLILKIILSVKGYSWHKILVIPTITILTTINFKIWVVIVLLQ